MHKKNNQSSCKFTLRQKVNPRSTIFETCTDQETEDNKSERSENLEVGIVFNHTYQRIKFDIYQLF